MQDVEQQKLALSAAFATRYHGAALLPAAINTSINLSQHDKLPKALTDWRIYAGHCANSCSRWV